MNPTETICYKEADGEQLLADLYLPQTTAPHPLFLYLHGGGWFAGDRKELQWFSRWAEAMLASGIAVASIEYRFCNAERSVDAPVTDCVDALQFFVREAMRWQLDMTRVAVGGISAGAHLAMMTAFLGKNLGEEAKSVPIRAIVALSGPTDLSRMVSEDKAGIEPCLRAILGGEPPYAPERMRAVSPLSWLKALPMQAHLPPILAIHGRCDRLVDARQPLWIAEEYARRGGSFRLVTVENAGHVFEQARVGAEPSMTFAEIQSEAAEFVLEHLC